MTHAYQFHSQLILRAPAAPFTLAVDEAAIQQALHDAHFMEAIYLASPPLHEECEKWRRGELTDARKVERLRGTLARYLVRRSSRSTPFGLFAGCTVAEWGPQSQIRLAPARHGRHTRLDMHYLCALAQHLAAHPGIRPHLRYWPNTSLYQASQQIRYVEHLPGGDGRVHQISAVEASETLEQVLAAAQAGLTLPQLAATLTAEPTEQEEAAEFVEALMEAQLLVSELEPTVTGPEYFHHILQVLNRLGTETKEPVVQAAAHLLSQVQQLLLELDAAPVNSAEAYQRIVAALLPLGVPVEAGKLFQTDAVCGLVEGAPATLDEALQTDLLRALEALTYLTPSAHNPRLDDFTRRFQARYEDQEVPLLEALDNESGLSYSDYGKSRFSALVHDLVLEAPGQTARSTPQNRVQQYMRQQLQAAERQRRYSVEVTVEELRAQGFEPETRPLPPSVPVLFRVTGGGQVLLESAGGSSAVNLLGRFAHAQPAVQALIRDITQQEQAHNPGVAFAEICHLPASRTGNLLQRPHFRALEIPYLAQSTLDASGQVRVQDLRLAVRAGQLVLRCARTNQAIVPRLSTAHNFAGDMLPVYQFLCDLQTQGVQPSLGFSWQAVAGSATFLPRLNSGNVVLAPATWHFTQADMRELLTATPTEVADRLAAFRHRWQLPRFFTLADGDNELFIDAENELLVGVWLTAVRSRPSSKLKEFLFDARTSPARDAAGQPYVPQFIALLLRQTPCYSAAGLVPTDNHEAVPREFSLGSEWLYYKLYCGQLLADRVLLEAIAPLTAELQEQGLADTWFFIRYADPDMHLRVRWHLPEPGRIGEVVRLISEYLQPFVESRAIWKVQTDTYRRELERYGSRSIGATEELFCYQSEALLARMAEAATEEAPAELWPWGLGAIEELLTAFGYSLARKLSLAQRLKESFAREFGVDKALRLQLDSKYRSARPLVQQAMEAVTNSALPLPAELLAITARINELEEQGRLEVPKDQLLASYLHMLLNRLLPAEARLHELVLYDFLFRHYQSCLARQQKQAQAQV